MEPTAEELSTFRTAKDLCDWAELVDAEEAAASPRRTFLAALGATENTKLFLLAAIPESTWQIIMSEWQIGNEKPTPIQLASAGYVGIAARLAAGIVPSRDQREQQKQNEMELEFARAKAVLISSPSSSGLIKMSTIIDQSSDREVAPLVESEVEAYYAVYRKLMGHDPRPEEDITAEQLSGLKALFTSGAAPYVDLAIWGPFGQRTHRKLKLSGLVLGTDGVLQQVQLYGPPDVETWAAGFAVFRTGCIMLEEVSISTLSLWSIMVSEYTARYGSAVWALIYQTEVRARSELLTRTKRAGATALAQATAAGGSHLYNPNWPWDWVFREAAADVQFWRKELEEKALLILAKISRPLDNVEGDALTSSQPGPKRPRDLGAKYSSAPPPHKKRDFERVHRTTADGISSHNRRGLELCAVFQKGECEVAVRDGICPRNSSHRHQCARCLFMGHGLSDCKGKPVADITSNRKGKGKS